MQYKIIEDHLG